MGHSLCLQNINSRKESMWYASRQVLNLSASVYSTTRYESLGKLSCPGVRRMKWDSKDEVPGAPSQGWYVIGSRTGQRPNRYWEWQVHILEASRGLGCLGPCGEEIGKFSPNQTKVLSDANGLEFYPLCFEEILSVFKQRSVMMRCTFYMDYRKSRNCNIKITRLIKS